AFSVAVSAVVALSFTPAMAALFLKHRPTGEASKFRRVLWTPFTMFERFFGWLTDGYVYLVRLTVRFWIAALALVVVVCAGSFWLYAHTPSSLVPQTDQGIVLAAATLPDASSLARTTKYLQVLSHEIEQIPGVQYVSTIAGYDLLSQAVNSARGTVFISLVPWDHRTLSADEVAARINRIGPTLEGGSVMAFNAPPIPGLSTTGGFTGYLESLGGAGPEALAEAARKVAKAANQRPELS